MFAPVAQLDTIRVIIALVAQWTIYQLDVKSVFLHGKLDKEVFVGQPWGYERKGDDEKDINLKILYMDLSKLQKLGIVV